MEDANNKDTEQLCHDCLRPKSASKFCQETGHEHRRAPDGIPGLTLASRLSTAGLRRVSSAMGGKKRPSTAEPLRRANSSVRFATYDENDDGTMTPRPGEDPFKNNWNSFRKNSNQNPSSQSSAPVITKRNSTSFRRGMSMATGAVHQFAINKEYTDKQDEEVQDLQDQRDELQRFVDDRETLLDNSGFRLNKFQDDCLQAIIARRVACKMLRGLRSKSITKTADEPGHGGRGIRRTLMHRSVLNKGPLGKVFVEAQRVAASAKSRPSSAPISGRLVKPAINGASDPPAIAAWRHLSRSRANNPTLLAFASTQSDQLQVLTTKIDWNTLLDNQTSQFMNLRAADEGYRSMLDKYEKYQALIQKRLDNLLSLDTLVPVSTGM